MCCVHVCPYINIYIIIVYAVVQVLAHIHIKRHSAPGVLMTTFNNGNIYCIIDVCPFWVKSLNKHPSMTFPYIYRNRPQRQQHTRTAIPKTHQKMFQRKFPFLNNEIRLCVHWPKRPTQNTHIHSHYNRNLTSNLFLSFNHQFDRVSCT